MPNNFLNPHFNCLPPSEAIEEVELFDFLVDLFFLNPLCQINKLAWFAIGIMTESFFTDSIILEIVLFIHLSDFLIVNNIELVYIFINLMILWVRFVVTLN